jgi:hypothetical protein
MRTALSAEQAALAGKKCACRLARVAGLADFSVTLEVASAEPCERALSKGVGHARAFGCGLLLVRRA